MSPILLSYEEVRRCETEEEGRKRRGVLVGGVSVQSSYLRACSLASMLDE